MHPKKISGLCVHIGAMIIALTITGLSFPVYAQQSDPTSQQSPDSGNKPAAPASNQDNSAPATRSIGDAGVPATVLSAEKVEGILGKEVQSRTGENMGRIVDVIVDRSAQVQGAVIDFGGFLGVGSRQIAVAWKALRFSDSEKSDVLIVDFSRDQLRVAPAYKAGEQVVLLGPPANPAAQAGPAPATSTPDAPSK